MRFKLQIGTLFDSLQIVIFKEICLASLIYNMFSKSAILIEDVVSSEIAIRNDTVVL